MASLPGHHHPAVSRHGQHRRCPALSRPAASPPTTDDHEVLADFAGALVSREVERSFEPGARLDPNGHIVFADGTQYWGSDYAVLDKCYNSERKQWAFYAAGPTRVGTTSAFSYLALHWPDLRRIFGDESPFSIVIRVLDGDPSRCEVVHRFSQRPRNPGWTAISTALPRPAAPGVGRSPNTRGPHPGPPGHPAWLPALVRRAMRSTPRPTL